VRTTATTQCECGIGHILVAKLLFELSFLLLLGDGVERLIVVVGQLVAAVLEHGAGELVELAIHVTARSR